MTEGDLNKRFIFHKPSPNALNLMDGVRAACHETAKRINYSMVDCREKSLAITKLEEAMFWANAGLARPHEPTVPIADAGETE